MNFFIPLIPEPQRRGKIVKRCKIVKRGKIVKRVKFSGLARTEKQELAETNLQAALMKYAPELPINGPVRITVFLQFPWPKSMSKKNRDTEPKHTKNPDIDNCLKHLFDCMTRCGFWLDDSQIYCLYAYKSYSDKPGWTVEILEAT